MSKTSIELNHGQADARGRRERTEPRKSRRLLHLQRRNQHGHADGEYSGPGILSTIRFVEGVPVFHEVRAPTIEPLRDLLERILTRIVKWLTRQGDLIEEAGMRYLGEIDADRALTPLPTASCPYRIATAAHALGRRC